MHLIKGMEESEDYIFIKRIQNGDHNAYAFLVDKYKKMVYTLALKTIGNVEDAQDAAQESFIKAFQNINSFKNEAKFSTWLYTITYRTAVYNLRKNKIPTQTLNEELIEDIQDDSTNDSIQEQEKTRLTVKKAIASLPKMEGLLISLFYINQCTINEISEITDLSKTNIKVKLYRARKKLKKKLNNTIAKEMNSF